MRETNLPHRFNQSVGDISVERGRSEGSSNFKLFSWDAINECMDEECIANEMCRYSRVGRCTIQLNYLKAFQDVIFRNYGNVFNESDMYYVGMHLTPLYKVLCKLKIEELAIRRVVNVDEKGIRRVNPVYKEIRETIKLINALWKSMGMTRGPAVDLEPEFGSDDDMIDGKTGEIQSPMDAGKKKKMLVKRR